MPVNSVILGGGDDKMNSMVQGLNTFEFGNIFIQYAGTTISNSTAETTLFGSTALGNTQTAGFGPFFPEDQSSLAIPGSKNNIGTMGALQLGTFYQGRMLATINNTATPTLRLRLVLRNTAGAITYTLSDTGAQTMTTITAGPWPLEILFDFSVAAVGATGSILGRVRGSYGTNVTATAFINAPITTTTVDTTQPFYTVDLLATFGAASASNVIIPTYANFGVVG